MKLLASWQGWGAGSSDVVIWLFVFQPWAFPAREFLRKKLIGKEVCFTIENKTPQGREYGMIYLGKGELQGGESASGLTSSF